MYRAGIEKADDGFVVNFAYGRRGATLNTGTKTPQPVTYAEAASIYEKLVRSQDGKGYKPVGGAAAGAGIGTSVTDREQRDTGLRAQLLNPITEDEAAAYLRRRSLVRAGEVRRQTDAAAQVRARSSSRSTGTGCASGSRRRTPRSWRPWRATS